MSHEFEFKVKLGDGASENWATLGISQRYAEVNKITLNLVNRELNTPEPLKRLHNEFILKLLNDFSSWPGSSLLRLPELNILGGNI